MKLEDEGAFYVLVGNVFSQPNLTQLSSHAQSDSSKSRATQIMQSSDLVQIPERDRHQDMRGSSTDNAEKGYWCCARTQVGLPGNFGMNVVVLLFGETIRDAGIEEVQLRPSKQHTCSTLAKSSYENKVHQRAPKNGEVRVPQDLRPLIVDDWSLRCASVGQCEQKTKRQQSFRGYQYCSGACTGTIASKMVREHFSVHSLSVIGLDGISSGQ